MPSPINRAGPRPVALETTLLLHGVPPDAALPLARELATLIRDAGASPALVGVVGGVPTVGMSADDLTAMLEAHRVPPGVPKANASNLGLVIHRRQHAATTVSATMELASAAGVRVFATGGIGGVHRGYAARLDISADLGALARVPIAVVASGVKGLLDVAATREALEALGVCVIGFGTDEFPAFYLRRTGLRVDGRFDDPADLAAFIRHELARRHSGILVCNPIPERDELDADAFAGWLSQAERDAAAAGSDGRDLTPAILARLHVLSHGATLRANLALARSNALLAAQIAAAL